MGSVALIMFSISLIFMNAFRSPLDFETWHSEEGENHRAYVPQCSLGLSSDSTIIPWWQLHLHQMFKDELTRYAATTYK